jgi:SRSO17 transposase
MSLLEHPKAQALLAEAEVTTATVRGCAERLTRFMQRYLPCFYRAEQRELAEVVVAGKLSNLQRKTSEPIAYAANRARKPVQSFVGAGKWDDEAVMSELRRHVAEEIGDADGVLVVDGSAFPKKGNASCGVARQWCGRLGKIDNCQVGVFVAYASCKGHAPLDRRLFLPEDWANDPVRRKLCHVPEHIVFQEKWRMALDLIERCRTVPHRWVAADDEFGRASAFRGWLRLHDELYVVDVPCNTLVREITQRSHGRMPAFEQAQAWAARQPARRWKTITVRQGEKGPIKVQALHARVQTKDEDGRVGTVETLVVTRTLDQDKRTTYHLSNAPSTTKLWQLVYVGSRRHVIEEVLQEGKGEVGLGHYEVRSWVGWHHHMTLSLLALWFLALERRRVGKKNPDHHGAADPRNLPLPAAAHAADLRRDRRRRQSSAPPHHRGPHLPSLRGHKDIPAAARAGALEKGLQ